MSLMSCFKLFIFILSIHVCFESVFGTTERACEAELKVHPLISLLEQPFFNIKSYLHKNGVGPLYYGVKKILSQEEFKSFISFESDALYTIHFVNGFILFECFKLKCEVESDFIIACLKKLIHGLKNRKNDAELEKYYLLGFLAREYKFWIEHEEEQGIILTILERTLSNMMEIVNFKVVNSSFICSLTCSDLSKDRLYEEIFREWDTSTLEKESDIKLSLSGTKETRLVNKYKFIGAILPFMEQNSDTGAVVDLRDSEAQTFRDLYEEIFGFTVEASKEKLLELKNTVAVLSEKIQKGFFRNKNGQFELSPFVRNFIHKIYVVVYSGDFSITEGEIKKTSASICSKILFNLKKGNIYDISSVNATIEPSSSSSLSSLPLGDPLTDAPKLFQVILQSMILKSQEKINWKSAIASCNPRKKPIKLLDYIIKMFSYKNPEETPIHNQTGPVVKWQCHLKDMLREFSQKPSNKVTQQCYFLIEMLKNASIQMRSFYEFIYLFYNQFVQLCSNLKIGVESPEKLQLLLVELVEGFYFISQYIKDNHSTLSASFVVDLTKRTNSFAYSDSLMPLYLLIDGPLGTTYDRYKEVYISLQRICDEFK